VLTDKEHATNDDYLAPIDDVFEAVSSTSSYSQKTLPVHSCPDLFRKAHGAADNGSSAGGALILSAATAPQGGRGRNPLRRSSLKTGARIVER
jgi:hypothetical protein